jgi:hypothetical protein
VFVGARYKHVKIEHLRSRPYIPEALHVILEQQRTDHTITNMYETDVRGDFWRYANPRGMLVFFVTSFIHLFHYEGEAIAPTVLVQTPT